MSVSNYIPRHTEPRIRESMNQGNLVLIKGTHRSGKTTLAQKMATEFGMRFFDLAKKNLQRQVQDNPQSFI